MMEDFAERFKELRYEMNISQKQLAKELCVSKAVIGFWENGKRIPSLENAKTIAVYFGVTIDYLAGLTDKK